MRHGPVTQDQVTVRADGELGGGGIGDWRVSVGDEDGCLQGDGVVPDGDVPVGGVGRLVEAERKAVSRGDELLVGARERGVGGDRVY